MWEREVLRGSGGRKEGVGGGAIKTQWIFMKLSRILEKRVVGVVQ